MSETGTRPQTKSELLQRIQVGWDDLHARLNQLSEAQKMSPDPQDGWAIKDHLSHLAAWEMGIAALLQHEPRYPAMGLDEARVYEGVGAFDALNEVIFQQHKEKTLAEVEQFLQSAHEALLGALHELSDADLQRNYAHYQPREPRTDTDVPIIAWVISNTYEHFEEHWPWIAAAARHQ